MVTREIQDIFPNLFSLPRLSVGAVGWPFLVSLQFPLQRRCNRHPQKQSTTATAPSAALNGGQMLLQF